MTRHDFRCLNKPLGTSPDEAFGPVKFSDLLIDLDDCDNLRPGRAVFGAAVATLLFVVMIVEIWVFCTVIL